MHEPHPHAPALEITYLTTIDTGAEALPASSMPMTQTIAGKSAAAITAGLGLSGPTPVAGVGGAQALRRTLFRPARVAFDDLDQVVDTAIETADIQGGYAQTLRVDRSTDRTMITVNVTSPRESVQVPFRADGTPVRTGDG